MSQKDYTTRRRGFQHLTREKRAQIEILLKQKVKKVEIAKLVGISRSTLYNELERGTVEQIDTELRTYRKYFWDVGQREYEKNRENSRPPLKLIEAYEFVSYADKQIKEEKLSPDSICGKAKLSGQFKKTVCTKTLYNYIDKRLLNTRNIDLLLKVKRKQKAKQDTNSKRTLGTSIDERPEEIDNRTEFGHWEIDTIVGKKESSCVLLSIAERMTREYLLVKIPSGSSESVRLGLEKIAERFGDRFEEIFKSVTADNGSEFVDLGRYLPESTKVYYAHPYSSYERGTNEKQNSLVRRFLPKGSSFDHISDDQVDFIQNWINNFPRKIFDYHSSDFLFKNVLFDIAI